MKTILSVILLISIAMLYLNPLIFGFLGDGSLGIAYIVDISIGGIVFIILMVILINERRKEKKEEADILENRDY